VVSRLVVEQPTGRVFTQRGYWHRWVENRDSVVDGIRWDWDSLVPTGEVLHAVKLAWDEEERRQAEKVRLRAEKASADQERAAWVASLRGRKFAGLTVSVSGDGELVDEWGNFILPMPSPRSDAELVSWIYAQTTTTD
jgi:hypothetical protein